MAVNPSTIEGLSLLAKTVSAQLGVGLVIQGETASTDGKTITVPDPAKIQLGTAAKNVLVGYVYHEASHVRNTDFAAAKSVAPGVFHIANILEDPRIEKRLWVAYPGSKARLAAVVDHLVESGGFAKPADTMSARELLSACLLYSMRSEVAEQHQLAALAADAKAMLTSKIGEQLVTRILSYARSGATASSTAGAVEAAQAIFAAIKEESEKQDQAAGQGSAADSDAGSTQDSDDGSKAGKGPGQGGGAPGSGESLKNLASDLSSMTKHDADTLSKQYDAGAAIGDQMTSAASRAHRSRGSGGFGSTSVRESMHRPGNNWARLNADAVTQSMRLQLESLLEADMMVARRTSTVGTEFHAGRMIDSALGSTRIFRRKSSKEDIHAAVGILVDCSGSMGGPAMDTAVLAAAVVGESVDWVGKHTDGNVALAVTGFDTNIYPVVEFGEDWRTARRNLGSMQACGGTLLSPATERMAANILIRDEPRKVIVCITDGMPSGHDVPRFKQTAADLRRNGVELYGILIGCNDDMGLFDKKARIDAIQELPGKLAEIVMSSIF